MNWISVNVFQKLIQQWEMLHPYNAAQVMRLSGRTDHDRLEQTWRQTLDVLRMTHAQVDGDRYRWRQSRPDQKPWQILQVPPGTTLDQFMSAELNRPFGPEDEPFRPFVIEQENSYFLGVVYHHWVADSTSIRMLLREWFLRLYEPSLARSRPFDAPEAGYWELFGPDNGGWEWTQSLLTMARWGTRFGKMRRVNAKRFSELETEFTFHRGPDGLIDSVAAAARRAGATINDVFLAAMAMVCHELLPLDQTPWRRELALGTIVDLRHRAKGKLDETFGLFLGFTTVFCRPDELADRDRLITAVHRQIARQKQIHSAEASIMRMVCGLAFARMFSRQGLLEFYRKRFGMTAGISNVNLNRDWPARYSPSPLEEYIRVSPCGPLMPVVFTPTTLGQGLDIGVTCRRSMVPEEGIHVLAERFIEHLQCFAQSRVPEFAD